MAATEEENYTGRGSKKHMLAQNFVIQFVSRLQIAIVRQVIEGFVMPFYAVRTGRNPGIYKDWYEDVLLGC